MSNYRIEDLIVGESDVIRDLRYLVSQLAPSSLPVLIEGPTGAGKELVAEALHRLSGRPGAFVAVNVCAIAESMFEDALFGHVRGSFSGAIADSPGFLQEGHRGSVFLDEIGGLAYGAQAKLLRAVELGRFRAVGARVDSISDFRVIAAANQALEELVSDGRFRLDLLQRLQAVVIRVPGLNDRVEDIALLTQVFARRLFDGKQATKITEGAIRALERREWPGNVRELKHTVERLLVLAGNSAVTRDDVERQGNRLISQTADKTSKYRRELVAVLAKYDWDIARTAAHLSVHRVTLWRWMRRFGLTRPSCATLALDRQRGAVSPLAADAAAHEHVVAD